MTGLDLWPADKVERRPLSALVPDARNARTHSEAQVAQIAASIREWGWTIPVLIDESGTLIAGHGRVLAAYKLGLPDVPCMTAVGWSETKRRAYMLADNRLALNAEWDDELLKLGLDALREDGFDLDLIGFDETALSELYDPDGGSEGNYSRKVNAPIYEPTGDKPDVAELTDATKTEALKAQIEAAELPADVAAFLTMAADRHTIFNFHRIADFYATAPADIQRLMEASALVIVDFEAAIENGFVALNKRLAGLADEADDDAVEAA